MRILGCCNYLTSCLLTIMTILPTIVMKVSQKSPYNQYLPDCLHTSYPNIQKKTQAKGIVCPMIKDEIGFLSEWTAFYEMQGFNHIIFFDNNSTTSLDELQPWIMTGFVTISKNWYSNEFGLFTNPKNKFNDMMRIKMSAEVQCKRYAVENGYEIFVSVDLDEFLMPTFNTLTVMDELVEWFNTTTRGDTTSFIYVTDSSQLPSGFAPITKLQFPSTPHVLEPINLLMIEAYQTRTREPDKMNYYTSVSKKVAIRLYGGEEYTNRTVELLVNCCDFHGCGNYKFHRNCPELFKSGEQWKVTGKHKKWKEPPHIHHYARSLEKYIMKQQTWDTSGSGRGYDIYNFLDRAHGFEYDDSAVPWGCQLRELLRNRTGEPDFIRPGDIWHRNPEFGKVVLDPLKRGRNGAGFGKQLGPLEMNPYPPGETYQRSHKMYTPGNRTTVQ